MVKVSLFLPLFSFILILFLSTPSFAILTPQANQNYTYSGEQDGGFDCYNSTDYGGVICLLATDGNILRKYNSTLHLLSQCALESSTYVVAINDTYIATTNGGSLNHIVDITNIDAGNCTIISNITGSNSNSGQPEDCAYYGNGADWIYCPFSDVFEIDFDTLTTADNWADDLWELQYGQNLVFPDSADNTTAYVMHRWADLTPYKFVNGINTINLTSAVTTLGIGGGFMRYGLVGNSLFVLQRATYEYRLWRFSMAEWNSLGTNVSFIPLGPLDGATIVLNPTDSYYNAWLQLITNSDGTLSFYHDGLYLSEMAINGSNINNGVFSTSIPFDGVEGRHNWTAFFVDNNSIQWSFATGWQIYNISTGITTQDYFSDPMKSLAIAVGSGLFGLTDLDAILALFSIFFSFACAVAVLYFGRKSKFGMQGFFATFFIMIMVFTIIGWFYTWAFAIMLLVVAFIFFMTIYNK